MSIVRSLVAICLFGSTCPSADNPVRVGHNERMESWLSVWHKRMPIRIITSDIGDDVQQSMIGAGLLEGIMSFAMRISGGLAADPTSDIPDRIKEIFPELSAQRLRSRADLLNSLAEVIPAPPTSNSENPARNQGILNMLYWIAQDNIRKNQDEWWRNTRNIRDANNARIDGYNNWNIRNMVWDRPVEFEKHTGDDTSHFVMHQHSFGSDYKSPALPTEYMKTQEAIVNGTWDTCDPVPTLPDPNYTRGVIANNFGPEADVPTITATPITSEKRNRAPHKNPPRIPRKGGDSEPPKEPNGSGTKKDMDPYQKVQAAFFADKAAKQIEDNNPWLKPADFPNPIELNQRLSRATPPKPYNPPQPNVNLPNGNNVWIGKVDKDFATAAYTIFSPKNDK